MTVELIPMRDDERENFIVNIQAAFKKAVVEEFGDDGNEVIPREDVEKSFAEAHDLEIVNVIPQPKAGGSFATAAYKGLEHPVLVETVKADAGLDIGGTLIGMHLKKVAVPVRLSTNRIGEACLIAARTRPKYIGGQRAVYNVDLA